MGTVGGGVEKRTREREREGTWVEILRRRAPSFIPDFSRLLTRSCWCCPPIFFFFFFFFGSITVQLGVSRIFAVSEAEKVCVCAYFKHWWDEIDSQIGEREKERKSKSTHRRFTLVKSTFCYLRLCDSNISRNMLLKLKPLKRCFSPKVTACKCQVMSGR